MRGAGMSADSHVIDGSQGEGGGQILRSSLALSLATGRGVTIENIRAGREKPGLMRQHLTAVQAAAEVCGGSIEGAAIGSTWIRFQPAPVRPGDYRFRVATAGSATLVLQTVLPALLVADGPSTLTLEGGTHNPWAPPFDFLEKAFIPLVNRMGPQVEVRLERHGFFPAGGGRITVRIEPSRSLAGFDLLDRGEIESRRARVLLANLPPHIGNRELDMLRRKLNWKVPTDALEKVDASGPGNVVIAELACQHVTEVFTGFGRQAVKAERAADEVVSQVRDYLVANVPVGPYLADQFLLPLGLSAWLPAHGNHQRGGSFRTMPLTRHSTTHIELLRDLLGISIGVESSDDGSTCVVHVGT